MPEALQAPTSTEPTEPSAENPPKTSSSEASPSNPDKRGPQAESTNEQTWKRGPVEKGAWNVCVGFLGPPGSGKTQGACRFVLELQRAPGCYVVCHDNGWRVPERLHDGKSTNKRNHESSDEAVLALRNGKTAGGIHVIPSDDAEEVISVAEACAAASLEANGGERGYPSIVFLDEVVAAGVCRANYLSPSMQHLLTMRRHKNVGVVWTCQTARLMNNNMLTLATELVIFRMSNKRDLDTLSGAGIEDDVIDKIRVLKDYESVRVKM